MTVYCTADTHFGHANIIRFCAWPFSGVADVVDGGRRVVMCHYPLMTWPGRGSYMVHGHIHDDTRGAYWLLLASYDNALNAGVDVNGFEPCTLDELVENNSAWKADHDAGSMTLAPADFDAFAPARISAVKPMKGAPQPAWFIGQIGGFHEGFHVEGPGVAARRGGGAVRLARHEHVDGAERVPEAVRDKPGDSVSPGARRAAGPGER